MLRRELIHSENGSTAVEYAIVLGLIVAVMLGTIRSFGNASRDTLSKVAESLSTSKDTAPGLTW